MPIYSGFEHYEHVIFPLSNVVHVNFVTFLSPLVHISLLQVRLAPQARLGEVGPLETPVTQVVMDHLDSREHPWEEVNFKYIY